MIPIKTLLTLLIMAILAGCGGPAPTPAAEQAAEVSAPPTSTPAEADSAEAAAEDTPAEAADAPEAAEVEVSAEAFPVTIEHKYGSTEITQRPERIVTVGLTDHDALLALRI